MTAKKRMCLVLAVLMMLTLVACGKETGETSPTTSSATGGASAVGTVYPDRDYGFQLEAPAAGETVAILHTSMGDISIRFFPEAAPKSVENFLTHAKNGYYDGLTFHRVVGDFMIQGGDPKGNGTGGESIWGGTFADEFDAKLMNLRGSLAMANSGVGTNGSQFFINQAKPAAGTTAQSLKQQFDYNKIYANYTNYYQQYAGYYGEQFTGVYPTVDAFIDGYLGGINPVSTMVPDAVWEIYAKTGGNINLDGAWRKSGGHTVFGQVYAGMEVVDAIAAVETDDNDKPKTDVIIKNIDVTTYPG